MTVLSLLKEGVKIVFPSGYWLQGCPSDNDIDFGYEAVRFGNWCLDEDGLKDAIADIKKMEDDDRSE